MSEKPPQNMQPISDTISMKEAIVVGGMMSIHIYERKTENPELDRRDLKQNIIRL